MLHSCVLVLKGALASALTLRKRPSSKPFMSLIAHILMSLRRSAESARRILSRGAGEERGITSVVNAARVFCDPEADEALMPLRTLLRASRKDLPVGLESPMNRFENRLARDLARQEQLRACEWKIVESRATEQDLIDHFEHLAGYTVEDLPRHRASGQRLPRKLPASKVRMPLARMKAGSAVLASIMMVCVVTWGSYGTDPLSAAIGGAVASESVLFGSLGETTRGQPDPELEQRRGQIREALDRIDQARTSVLGFHTGYEPSALLEAARLVEKAAQSVSPVEPTPLELYRLRDEILHVLGASPSTLQSGVSVLDGIEETF